HQVDVGKEGLTFTPNQLTAAIGNAIQFNFNPKNCLMTQSMFAAPCMYMPNGADSDFMPVAAGAATEPTYMVTVTAMTPLWFYCRQANHCQQGTVFGVN
ncbi:hypothetical protein BGW80DRAFT_1142443, partial [Lactifluus volemus]